jgi:large exoprotein involved in heme utilization and adhesion
VGVVVYDLRKPQPGWTQFANVKVIESALGRTVVNVAGAPGPANLVVVRNLPRSVKPGEQITFFAKPVDSANTPASGQKTPRNYDAGVPCGRADIPEALLASAVSSAPAPSKQ